MSPRRLDGREPRLFTEYEYERAERSVRVRWRWLDAILGWFWAVANPPVVVRAASYSEPEWSPGDIAALVAVREQRKLIGPHGWPIDEAMSPDGDPSSWDAKYQWVVPPPSVDYAQRAIDIKKAEYAKEYPNVDMNSLRWRVERRDLDV